MSPQDPIFFFVALAAAGFTMAAVIGNWDWFFNNSKARFFTETLGREGARVFYAILAVVILVAGILASGPR